MSNISTSEFTAFKTATICPPALQSSCLTRMVQDSSTSPVILHNSNRLSTPPVISSDSLSQQLLVERSVCSLQTCRHYWVRMSQIFTLPSSPVVTIWVSSGFQLICPRLPSWALLICAIFVKPTSLSSQIVMEEPLPQQASLRPSWEKASSQISLLKSVSSFTTLHYRAESSHLWSVRKELVPDITLWFLHFFVWYCKAWFRRCWSRYGGTMTSGGIYFWIFFNKCYLA